MERNMAMVTAMAMEIPRSNIELGKGRNQNE